MYAGADAYLHCKCKLPPIYRGRRNDPRDRPVMEWNLPNGEWVNVLNPALDGRAFAYFNGTLVVRRAEIKDEGDYVCYMSDAYQRCLPCKVENKNFTR